MCCALSLAGCVPQDDVAPTQSYGLVGFDPNAGEAAKQSCLAKGGDYRSGGIAGLMVCFETPKDAGKSCAKATDCESQCLARTKSCAPIKPLFGCHAILDSSGREVTICVD